MRKTLFPLLALCLLLSGCGGTPSADASAEFFAMDTVMQLETPGLSDPAAVTAGRDAVRTGKMREAAAFHAAHTLRLRYRWMLWAVWLAAGIGGIVLLAVIIDWENAFTLMHKIFFDNDDWLFNPQTDPIITILPDTFFMHCGLLIIGLTILFCAGLQLLYHRKTRNTHGKSHF